MILSERTLADTDEIFAAAVVHLARKLGRVKPLDASTLPRERAQIVEAFDAWAGDEVDWRGELARFYEDHITLHLRPDSALNAALRQLQAAGIRLACWSAGPDAAAEIVVHQLGLGRRIERIASGASADVAVLLADELAPSRDQALVVADDAAALGAGRAPRRRRSRRAVDGGRARGLATRLRSALARGYGCARARGNGGGAMMDEDRRLDTLLERIDLLRHELEVIGRRLDGLEGLNRISEELHDLNGSLQALAYAALGRRGPDIRRNG